MAITTKSAQVSEQQTGRADRVVRSLTGLPHSKLRGLFDHGCVRLNGEPCDDPAKRVNEGDQVEVAYDPQRGYPEKKRDWVDSAFTIVFEDQHLIVVNKSANVLTVATERGGDEVTLVDRVSHYLKHTSRRREALVVHRLDRGVSGLLVFAKTRIMLEKLQDQFKGRKPERRYAAIVAGVIKRQSGTFRSYLQTGKNLNEYSTREPSQGKLAITHYRVQQTLGDTTVVEVRLETGRRNQIRVHFADANHPVLGDPRYGKGRGVHPRWPQSRLALHAQSLGFLHPAIGKPLFFESELPSEMQQFIRHAKSR